MKRQRPVATYTPVGPLEFCRDIIAEDSAHRIFLASGQDDRKYST